MKIWASLGGILLTLEFVYKFGVYNVRVVYGRQIFYQNLIKAMNVMPRVF